MSAPVRPSLWRHRDFLHLWTAESVSQLGTQVSQLALPLVAIKLLHATPFEVGALTAIEFSPFVLFGLPAGVVVDRLRRRPVLILADLGRALALITVPIAYAFDVLSLAQLLVVVFVTGTLTVFFDVAYQAYLPALVARDQLVEGNAKLEISRSGAQIAGPGLGGLLVQWLGAATAVVADAASFVASAFSISRIRGAEPAVETAEPDGTGRLRRLGREIREGLHYVLSNRILRSVAASTATSNYFSSMSQAVFLLYAVRELRYGAGLVGLVFVVGNVGFLTAAVFTARITRVVHLGPAIWLSMLIASAGGVLLGVAPRVHAFPWFAAVWALFTFGGTIYNINQVSLRQAITPHRLQGRMNASMRFMVWGTMPFGSLTGGVLGGTIGLRPTLLVAGIGGMTAVVFLLLCAPLRALREFPAYEEDPTP